MRQSEAWNITHSILQSSDATVEAKMFAATTLKGKVCLPPLHHNLELLLTLLAQIIYDLDQLPSEALGPLRDSLVSLLQTYSDGPRPIRTQICVCLASLAIQHASWKDVLRTIGSAVQGRNGGGDALLEFLRILPEEVTDGRKINMTVCSAY